jgi:hypothetical protein
MQGLVAAGLAAFIVVNTIVAFRLLGRFRRQREAPELLLGLALLTSASLGYPSIVLAAAAPELGPWLSHLGLLAFQVGVSLYAHFNARVFRPGVGWASAFASTCTHIFAVVLAVVVYLPFAVGSPEAAAEHVRPFVVLNQGTLVAISAWVALEGGLYYARLRKRRAVGLADPLIVNRFLLWTVQGTLSLANMLVAFWLMLGGENVVASTLSIASTSASGLVGAVLTVLIFMPPAWYQRRFAPAPAGA